MVRQCSGAHCSAVDAEINQVCKEVGWSVNHPVFTRDANGPCTCSCSCLAFGTPVQATANEFKAIEEYAIGDPVYAADADLNWTERRVEFSQGTTGASVQKYTILIVFGDDQRFLAVTSDHVFMLADRSLKVACRLNVDDKLIAPDGSPISIHSVHIGDYTAGFHHIATAKKAPDERLDGNLLNTNGVVSGDYSLQLFHRSGEERGRFDAAHDDLPVVGSPEYVAQHGDACLKAPAAQMGNLRMPQYSARDLRATNFVAAANTRLVIPDDAHGFLPDDIAREKSKERMRPWNDPQAREWTEYLINFHRFFYPNVVYHFDWADNTVNAYAWVQNGVRNVAILGGLVRHFALELEGVALVLAHELAHHYGGDPTFPGGLSCEGQSDYYGVAVVMRRVWFGEDFILKTDRGIDQMAQFFGVPNDPTVPGGSAGCTHPPGACRIATYHSAVTLGGLPACAR